jgi:cytochrome c oxidase cbb3-type subunit IV
MSMVDLLSDITTWQAVATVVSFITFGVICVWAYSRRNAAGFNEAAQLPFQE